MVITCAACGRKFFSDAKEHYEKHLPWCEAETKGKAKRGEKRQIDPPLISQKRRTETWKKPSP